MGPSEPILAIMYEIFRIHIEIMYGKLRTNIGNNVWDL
jgi:hypothetical protein